MKFLLDTHALIWHITDDKSLSETAQSKIEDPNAVRFVSIVSFWEIAIKYCLGKLAIGLPFTKIIEIAKKQGFIVLPIRFRHLLKVSTLPHHHRDPFDRMLIAQALLKIYQSFLKIDNSSNTMSHSFGRKNSPELNTFALLFIQGNLLSRNDNDLQFQLRPQP